MPSGRILFIIKYCHFCQISYLHDHDVNLISTAAFELLSTRFRDIVSLWLGDEALPEITTTAGIH